MSGGGRGRRPGRGGGADLLDWGVAVGRMSCAVSLAAAEQLSAALAGKPRRAEATLDAIRDAAEAGLDGHARDLFRLGEQLGRGMVETTARLVDETRGGSLDPERLGARARRILGRAFGRRPPCPRGARD